jgi:geranylgeranyl pyrophosphate synthase
VESNTGAVQITEHNVLPGEYITLLNSEFELCWADGERGRLEAICRYALAPGGKLLRPILLLESAVAVGGRAADVLPAAVGTECGHVASLVHDDIIDGDLTRRGRPAVHAAYGRDDAIVAGDALIFFLFRCLAACRATGVDDSRIVSALGVVAQAGYDMCRGQSLEAEVCGDLSCDVATYLEVIRLKTAAFFRAACQSGAILGGGSDEETGVLGAYGDHLGAAFQIHDDLLGYDSTPEETGKSAVSDIRNRRLTLPVILAYETGTPADRRTLEHVLSGVQDGTLDENAAYGAVYGVLHRTGALEASRERARRHSARAREVLSVLPPSPSADRLSHIARLAVTRKR